MIDLWDLARTANFTEKELEAFRVSRAGGASGGRQPSRRVAFHGTLSSPLRPSLRRPVGLWGWLCALCQRSRLPAVRGPHGPGGGPAGRGFGCEDVWGKFSRLKHCSRRS